MSSTPQKATIAFTKIDDLIVVELNGVEVWRHGNSSTDTSPFLYELSSDSNWKANENNTVRVVAHNGPGWAQLKGSLTCNGFSLEKWDITRIGGISHTVFLDHTRVITNPLSAAPGTDYTDYFVNKADGDVFIKFTDVDDDVKVDLNGSRVVTADHIPHKIGGNPAKPPVLQQLNLSNGVNYLNVTANNKKNNFVARLKGRLFQTGSEDNAFHNWDIGPDSQKIGEFHNEDLVIFCLKNGAVTVAGEAGTGNEIQDNTTQTYTAQVEDNLTTSDVLVRMDVSHPYTSDLEINLQHPDGQTVKLFEHSSTGRSAGGIQGTVFGDSAAKAITAGKPPYTGYFKPVSPLSAFAGKNAKGTWKLTIKDKANADHGTLKWWSLYLIP
ncbi:MAG: proprotein convertase P-domain-containing protein [Bacteroidota bacterium]